MPKRKKNQPFAFFFSNSNYGISWTGKHQAKRYLEKARELFQDLQELNRLAKKWQDC
jgi:hypothetical protein